MKCQSLFYFDRCLSMGCSCSCAIFEAFSTALEWLAVNRFGASGVLHILCQYLGVSKAQEKTIGPEPVLQFVGITLDSVTQEARL